jgi:mono/diheme cytochrome c family protein
VIRRTTRVLLALLVLVVALFAVLASGAFERSVVGSEFEQALAPERMRELADKGRVLVDAADCYACHTDRDGPAWAGGLALELPVGILRSTNISPDKEFGIGNWTRAEFHRAVRDGIGKGGRHLYPAMPYASYRALHPEDVDAMYAFLMSREPVRQPNRDNSLVFPFNLRPLIAVWNLIALPRDPFPAESSRSAAWNRGNYVVNALGHCGECHTPRNLMMVVDNSRHLQGAAVEGIEAPDITATGLAAMGFEPVALKRFMREGLAPQGAATHQMFDVIKHSTQHWSDADLSAMASYLLGDLPPVLKAAEAAAVKPEVTAAGRQVYLGVCAGCHGVEGEGVPNVAVALRTNASLRLESPRNFLQAVLHGLPEQDFPGLARMQAMPGFASLLTDQEIANLASWMRAAWGGRAQDVPPALVAKARR